MSERLKSQQARDFTSIANTERFFKESQPLSWPPLAKHAETINALVDAHAALYFNEDDPGRPLVRVHFLNPIAKPGDLFKRLGELTTLQRLDMRGQPLGDADLEPLKTLTELRLLDVRFTQVTPGGVEGLKKALPRLEVKRD